MNVVETKKRIEKCETVNELLAFKDDDRKTVIDAVESKKKELLALAEEIVGSENTDATEKDESGAENTDAGSENDEAGAENTDASEKAPEPVTDMWLKHHDFTSKIPFGCRAVNIVNFAEEFFGKKLKSAKHEVGTTNVHIHLKNGDKFTMRGL